MTAAQLIHLGIQVSIVLLVFGFGLHATWRDVTYFFRHPRRLARAVCSIYIIMPAVAVILALAFDLTPEVKLALVMLSLSPVPPFLPGKALKAGGEASYTIGLLTVMSLLAFILIPLILSVLGFILSRQLEAPLVELAKILSITVLAPLLAGALLNTVAPALAQKIAKPISTLAMVMLVAALVPVLFNAWPAIVSLVGHGTLLAIVGFVAIGLVVGHLLGGPDPENRPVLALATSARHPAVAIAIAHFGFPGLKLTGAAVLLYLLVSAIATIPYMMWVKRRHRQSAV